MRLLDLRSGAARTASGRHSGAVLAADFTPDGRTLVTAGEDGDVIVWDVQQGTPAETLSGHASGIDARSQITPRRKDALHRQPRRHRLRLGPRRRRAGSAARSRPATGDSNGPSSR